MKENNKVKFDKVFDLDDVCFPCIYFLIMGGKIVYVGQTKSGMKRILCHLETKEFDSIGVIRCEEKDLDEKETYYIAKLNPLYNKTLTNAQSSKRIKQILKSIGFNVLKRDIDRWIKINVPEHYVYNGALYINGDNLSKCIDYFVNKSSNGKIG